MKWFKAKSQHICSSCTGLIDIGELYLGSSSSAFCETCGKKHQNGELEYSQKDKRYIDVSIKKGCDFCDNQSIGHIHGKSVCEDCIGKQLSDKI